MFDIQQLRSEFPILSTKHHGKPLVYLDNAATTQKPTCVLDSIYTSYTQFNANVHRGTYHLSQEATRRHEEAREFLAHFIGAEKDEIIFTRGTTEGINTIVYTFGNTFIQEGDNIVVTIMDHHSNFVPWQQLALHKGATFTVVTTHEDGRLNMEEYKKALTPNTKLVAFPLVSNVLGTVTPAKEMITLAHQVGAKVVVDGAQAIAHMPVNVKKLDADFFVCSSHKMYGPNGIGLLYGKRALLESIPPFLYGGEMIQNVTIKETTFAQLPYKFEAGTPDYIGSVAFAEAARWILSVGYENIMKHEQALLRYATEQLTQRNGVHVLGSAPLKECVIAFNFDNVHPYDLAVFLDQQGVAIRTGHHCAEPLLASYGCTSAARLSFAAYNTMEEVDLFMAALDKSLNILA